MQTSIAKKIFAVGSAAAMVAALMPALASAAVHSAGTNCVSNGTVYFISASGQKQAYTSAGAFLSYGTNSWSNVVQCSAEDLALPSGSFVAPADGSVINDKGTVYVITGGQRAGFTNPQAFLGLGFSWSQVIPGDTSFLTALAPISSSASAHLAGTLVNQDGTVYLMSSTGKMGIPTPAVFNSWGYSWNNVVLANSYDRAISMSNGVMPSMAAGYLNPLAQVAAGASGPGTVVVPVSGGLNVSLASNTPVSSSLVVDATNGGQAVAPLATFNFTAGSAAAQVNTVVVHRTGISSDSNINNAYLYNGSTRVATMQSISNAAITFTNSTSGLFTVPANSTYAITVKIDLAKGTGAGQTIGVALNSVSDVTTSGNGSVSGTFPAAGNLMTVATVTNLGKITVAAVSDTTNVTPQTNFELWRFSLAAANQNIAVTHIAFTNLGSTGQTDIQNLKLYDGGTQIGTTVANQDANRMVTFDFPSTPYVITSGVTKNLSLRGDIIGGSSRTFRYSIQNSSDLQATDTQYNVSLFPGGAATFSSVTAVDTSTISSGTLSVAKTSDSPTGNVAVNGTNVTLGKFSLLASGENIKVSTLTVFATTTGNNTFLNMRLFYGTASTGPWTQIGTTINAPSMTADNDFSLGNSLVVPAGSTYYITVVGDLTGTLVNTNSVSVTLDGDAGNAYGQGQTSLTTIDVPAADVTGNTLTVSSSSLTAGLNPSLGSTTVVGGATNQTIGSFVLTAGAAEGVNLNNVTINDGDGDGAADADAGAQGLGSAFNNIKLFYNGAQVPGSNVIVNPSSTEGTAQQFSFSPALTIPAGGSIQLDVHADVLASPTWTTGKSLRLTTATSGTGATTNTSVSGTNQQGQGITIASSGTITVAVDGSTPSIQQVVMGSTGIPLGVWQFSANNVEPINVNQLIVSDTGSVGGDIQNLKLQVNGTTVATVPALSSGTTGTATFGSSSATLFTVPQNGSLKVTLVADVTNNTNATGNGAITLNLQTPSASPMAGASTDKMIARGANSGSLVQDTTSQTYSANSAYAFRTKIVATNVTVSGSSTGRVRQANDNIFAMNLAANAGYQVAFRAAAYQSAATSSTAFTGALSTAATWTATNGGSDNGTLSTDVATPLVSGSGDQMYTAGATVASATGDGLTDTFASTDFSGYNGVAFWARETGHNVALSLTLTGATGSKAVSLTNLSQWKQFFVPFSGNFTANLNAVTAFKLANTAVWTAGDTLQVANIYFYKDFIKANINGTAALVNATLVTAKDLSSGTTFATGYFGGTAATATANTSGVVYLFPTAEFDVTSGGNRTVSLVADTSALINAAANSLSVNVNLGTSASTLAAPGDIVWYDGKVAQFSGAGNPNTAVNSVVWLDTNPSPVQGGTLGY